MHVQDGRGVRVRPSTRTRVDGRRSSTDAVRTGLNACWNSAFRKSFGFHRWESVRQFIHGLGRLDLIDIFMLRKSKFMCKTYQGSNTLMHNLLWCYFSSSVLMSCYVLLFSVVFTQL